MLLQLLNVTLSSYDYPMGFIANFKAKRAAKKAQAIYELEQNEWEQENRVLNAALDIFTSALKGEEPNDLSLAQKKR